MFYSLGCFKKMGKISLSPSSAVFHVNTIPVKPSLLIVDPSFHPIPSVHLLLWNAFNLRKICCLWQSVPSLVITAFQVLYGNIQTFWCLSQVNTVSESYSAVGKRFWDDSAPSHSVFSVVTPAAYNDNELEHQAQS